MMLSWRELRDRLGSSSLASTFRGSGVITYTLLIWPWHRRLQHQHHGGLGLFFFVGRAWVPGLNNHAEAVPQALLELTSRAGIFQGGSLKLKVVLL